MKHTSRLLSLILISLGVCLNSYASGMKNDSVTQILDEGIAKGDVRKIDCIGSDILCAASGGTGTVTISSSSAPGWTDNGDQVNTTTSADTVGIGNSGLGRLNVFGSSDIDQLFIKGNATQTAKNLIHVVANDNTTRFAVSGDGTATFAGSSAPGMKLGSGSTTNYPITFDVSGTDTIMVGTSGNVSFSHDITVSGDNITMGTNTKGDVLASNGSTMTLLPVGASNGMVLSVDSATSTGLKWGWAGGGGGGSGDMILADAQTNTGVKTFNTGTLKFPDLAYIIDANNNELISFDSVGSATNYFMIADAATGTNPIISADGSDANIGIHLNTKGTGGVAIQTIATATQSTISAGLSVNNSSNNATEGTFNVLSADGARIISSDPTIGGLSTTGKFIGYNSEDLGWSFVNGTDNTACNTQCRNACVVGVLNATGVAVTNFVNCSDATADECICAGPA